MTEPREEVRDENGAYEAPAIVDTADFETLAMACGKFDPDLNPNCLGDLEDS